MFGRSKRERCGRCGRHILVPQLASTAHCPACHLTTSFPANRARHHDPIRHVRGWLRGMFSTVGSGSDSFGSSSGYRQWVYGDCGGTSAVNWPASFPANRTKKRAVLIGVSYAFRSYELKGTVNDVNCMRYFLCEKFQFPDDSILVLTEQERDPKRIPTKENIRAAMRWLVHGNEAGDSLVFHFSGHGSQKLDASGDELDGYAETLCPVDYEEKGVILDDELNATLVRPLRPGTKLHAFIDACHSGTVLDLPYLCRTTSPLMGKATTALLYKQRGVVLERSVEGFDEYESEESVSCGESERKMERATMGNTADEEIVVLAKSWHWKLEQAKDLATTLVGRLRRRPAMLAKLSLLLLLFSGDVVIVMCCWVVREQGNLRLQL